MERLQVYIMSIKFKQERMIEMDRMIETFLKNNKIDIKVPVDVFEVASLLGFDVRGAEFRESLEGLLLVDENSEKIIGFDSNKVIAYNCKKDIYMKKFIVAHELAHYIKEKSMSDDKKIVLARREHQGEYSNNEAEQEMDYMAASILMPRKDFEKQFGKKNKNITDEKFIYTVAARYNVNNEMAQRRIEEVLNGGE